MYIMQLKIYWTIAAYSNSFIVLSCKHPRRTCLSFCLSPPLPIFAPSRKECRWYMFDKIFSYKGKRRKIIFFYLSLKNWNNFQTRETLSGRYLIIRITASVIRQKMHELRETVQVARRKKQRISNWAKYDNVNLHSVCYLKLKVQPHTFP